MANNRTNRVLGAFALSAVLMAVPSCTDTWDDHYGIKSESASGATQTLWEIIKDNPDFSNFAKIVENAKYYKDNEHPVSGYSFADILNSGQVNTVWVPDNSALTDEKCQEWLDMLGESRADDGEDNISAGYNVQQQLLGNHIALWRHNISEGGVDTVKMINGKNLVFDKTAKTLGGVALGDINIPTKNGVMHTLKGVAPFHYNFYEYLKFPAAGQPRTKFGEYIVEKDTTYFAKSASIEGLPDENGNPTYVDSVYFTSNRLFERTNYLPDEGREKWLMVEKGFGAPINKEDSAFVMLLPTDAAWDATYEKLKPAYKYAATYEDKTKGDNNNTTTMPVKDVDSLQQMSIVMDMISPLVFNLHKQPKKGDNLWSKEDFSQNKEYFDNHEDSKKYLLNTYGDTLRALPDWQPSSLFNGTEIEMSNGLGYEIDTWNFPSQFYTPDVEVEIENTGMFYNTRGTSYSIGRSSQRYTFPKEEYQIILDKYGNVSHNNFYHIDSPGGTAKPTVEIKLFGNDPTAYVPNAQVMSGKYDIQVVLVPHWYIDIADGRGDKFVVTDTIVNEFDITDTTFVRRIDEEAVQEAASKNKYKFTAKLSYRQKETGNDKSETLKKDITYDGLNVQVVTLKENFPFPFSYKNMRFSYPVLQISGSASTTDVSKKGFVYDLVVDKVILKRKD